MKRNSSSFSSSKIQNNILKKLNNNKLGITCQLELRRVSLLLLLIVGTTFEQTPSCLATNIDENEGIEEYLPFSSIDGGSKRGGARAFQRPNFDDISYELKRGGARTFSIENKRGGARAFSKNEEKRGGARPFNEEKRGGARPFYGFFGGGDNTWKRGGGRFFIRPFADHGSYGGIGGSSWAKRGGGRQFSADKRAGGRNFFGNLDSAFDSSNYWISPRYIPLKKAIVNDYQIIENASPFYSHHFNN